MDNFYCTICCNKIQNGGIIIPCNHTFHLNCLIRWFQILTKKKKIKSCPYCRKEYEVFDFEIIEFAKNTEKQK